ncbi:PepSY domain-containing protein, partial [Amnimonas aquatica]
MTGSQSIKRWYGVHKWTSLICTAFMLLLCITGLPLVFHHEIEEWLEHGDDHHAIAAVAPGEASPDLDRMLAKALERH